MIFPFRNDNLQPVPEKLGSVYLKKFLQYFDDNPSLGIECYGLNCSAPEELKETLDFTFQKTAKVSLDLEIVIEIMITFFFIQNCSKLTFSRGEELRLS